MNIKVGMMVLLGAVLSCSLPGQAKANTKTQDIDICLSPAWWRDLSASESACSSALKRKDLNSKIRIELLNRRSDVYQYTSRLDLALQDANDAQKLDPNNMETALNLSWIELYRGDVQAAFDGFTAIIANHPESPDGYWGLGHLYIDARRYDLAEKAYKDTLKADSKFLKAHLELVGIYQTVGNNEAALASCDAILAEPDGFVRATRFKSSDPTLRGFDFKDATLVEKARLLHEVERQGEAITILDDLSKRHPQSPYIFSLRAEAKIYHEDLHGALADARKSKSVDDISYGYGYAREIQALNKLGMTKDAVRVGEEAKSKPMFYPAKAAVLFWLAVAQEKDGNFDAALQNREAAQQIDPEYRELIIFRAIQGGYYDGKMEDEYSERAANGVKACIIDPECD